jgi:hypothetical protein
METQKETIRISVPNFICSSLCFTHDGRLLLSGMLAIAVVYLFGLDLTI